MFDTPSSVATERTYSGVNRGPDMQRWKGAVCINLFRIEMMINRLEQCRTRVVVARWFANQRAVARIPDVADAKTYLSTFFPIKGSGTSIASKSQFCRKMLINNMLIWLITHRFK